MAYTPLNLTGLQIGLESGGSQFDKNGKPLTSPKGAVGVAQVMPDTGPEAAKLAGLPWDESRYRNDREYNLRLGDAYQGSLNKRFGEGSVAAMAAYNAGPTRVANLQAKHGADFAKFLPDETKHYLKVTKGIDVGGGYYPADNPRQGFADDILAGLGLNLEDYKVNAPGPNDRSSLEGTTTPPPEVASAGRDYTTSSGRYTTMLEQAIAPLHANAERVIQQTQGIADTKHALYGDFAAREKDLESKLTPLQERRQAILQRLTDLDAMSPFERKLKSAFNSDYDSRVLRGRLDRVENLIAGHEKTYTELNTLRSGVAALSVDATQADTAVVNAQSSSILADAQLMGQVTGAVRQNVDAKLLPYQLQVETARLAETKRKSILGRMTLEDSVKAVSDAQASPTGKITIDGSDFTVGDLQDTARANQVQDLSLRSLQNAYKTRDLQTADQTESYLIEHMSQEQVTEAIKNGGVYKGQQLSMLKLTQVGNAVAQQREQSVNEVVLNSSYGQASTLLHGLGDFIKSTGARATDMFGNTPGELSQVGSVVAANVANWQKGFEQAKAQGVGREYIARTADQLTGYQSQMSNAVDLVAKKWGGGKPELEAVASAYLRGNPLSGDAATKGLITMARSGMPAGSKLTGPAMQAFQAAQSIVKQWYNPDQSQSGDSLQALLKGGSKKDSDLIKLVQDRVGNVYADAITDQLMNQLPELARGVRDPNSPGQPHPFARISKEDFVASVRHGDAEGYGKIGHDLGLTPQQTQRMFAEGVSGPIWAQVAQSKGFGTDKFSEFMQTLQAVQMAGTLTALDASHAARPGFSPAKAYVDLLQNQEIQNHIDKVVNGYGRSGFGAFLASSAVGGGYRESWNNYSQSLAAVYTQLHGSQLADRIKQQRSLAADPFVRMAAVNRASGLSPAESTALLQATKPLVNLNTMSDSQALATGGLADPLMRNRDSGNFDAISNIIRNHKFDNPQIERIRQKAAKQWEAMDAVVGNVTDSLTGN